nr:helix-turn-helix domain-containing protein [Enterococcus alishanensis]
MVLTKREFRVLQELIEADGRPLSQEELCRLVWDKAVLNASIKCQLSTLIRKLRDKMDHAGFCQRQTKNRSR